MLSRIIRAAPTKRSMVRLLATAKSSPQTQLGSAVTDSSTNDYPSWSAPVKLSHDSHLLKHSCTVDNLEDPHKGIDDAEKSDEPLETIASPTSDTEDEHRALKRCCPPSRQTEEVLKASGAMTGYSEHTKIIEEMTRAINRPLNESEIEECMIIIRRQMSLKKNRSNEDDSQAAEKRTSEKTTQCAHSDVEDETRHSQK